MTGRIAYPVGRSKPQACEGRLTQEFPERKDRIASQLEVLNRSTVAGKQVVDLFEEGPVKRGRYQLPRFFYFGQTQASLFYSGPECPAAPRRVPEIIQNSFFLRFSRLFSFSYEIT